MNKSTSVGNSLANKQEVLSGLAIVVQDIVCIFK